MFEEIRSHPRKILRCPALVALPNAPILRGRTVDVSLGGVSIMLPEQMRVGSQCKIAIEPQINGKGCRIVASAKVAYSVLSGSDGFRVGFQFTQLDAENNKTLAVLMI